MAAYRILQKYAVGYVLAHAGSYLIIEPATEEDKPGQCITLQLDILDANIRMNSNKEPRALKTRGFYFRRLVQVYFGCFWHVNYWRWIQFEFTATVYQILVGR